MPAYFNEGVFVEKTAWHNLGTVSRRASGDAVRGAIKLAGHDYHVVERVNADLGGKRGGSR